VLFALAAAALSSVLARHDMHRQFASPGVWLQPFWAALSVFAVAFITRRQPLWIAGLCELFVGVAIGLTTGFVKQQLPEFALFPIRTYVGPNVFEAVFTLLMLRTPALSIRLQRMTTFSDLLLIAVLPVSTVIPLSAALGAFSDGVSELETLQFASGIHIFVTWLVGDSIAHVVAVMSVGMVAGLLRTIRGDGDPGGCYSVVEDDGIQQVETDSCDGLLRDL
jgi:hypothetical protein